MSGFLGWEKVNRIINFDLKLNHLASLGLSFLIWEMRRFGFDDLRDCFQL